MCTTLRAKKAVSDDGEYRNILYEKRKDIRYAKMSGKVAFRYVCYSGRSSDAKKACA